MDHFEQSNQFVIPVEWERDLLVNALDLPDQGYKAIKDNVEKFRKPLPAQQR